MLTWILRIRVTNFNTSFIKSHKRLNVRKTSLYRSNLSTYWYIKNLTKDQSLTQYQQKYKDMRECFFIVLNVLWSAISDMKRTLCLFWAFIRETIERNKWLTTIQHHHHLTHIFDYLSPRMFFFTHVKNLWSKWPCTTVRFFKRCRMTSNPFNSRNIFLW